MTARRARRRSLRFLSLGCVLLVPPAFAQVQTKDQQKCTVAMGKALQKVASTLGTDVTTCLKYGAKGQLVGTVEACIGADVKGKVALAAAKTTTDFDKLCTGMSKDGAPKLPPYGVVDAATVNDAGRAKEPALFHDVFHDVFGDDLDAALLLESADKNGAKCQQAVASSAKKCQDAKLKEFVTCAALGLKAVGAPFDDAADLAACIGADPQGKIAKACDLREETSPGKLKVDAIRKTLDLQCAAKGVDLAEAVPGCAPGDVEATHACVDAAVECRVCLASNGAAGLARDCDVFDAGAANGSCGGIGRHTCTLDGETSAFFFDTAIFSDIFPVEGSIDVACGAVDPSTGNAPCSCALGDFPPVPIIPGIGVACVNPAPGCPTGQIGCNGGEDLNSILTSDHDIGTCTGNADCAAQCATTCGSATVWDSGCEGFCRGGANDDDACESDDDCPGGACVGVDAAAHGNVCQCECLDGAGEASRPGALRCNVGIDIDVERAEPCGDGDLLFRVGRRCVPFTTETAQRTILDANAETGETLPPGIDIAEGIPLACPDLAANGPSGMLLVSGANAFDVDLAGDIAFLFFLNCQ